MEESFLYFGYGSGLNPTLVAFRVNEPVEVLEIAVANDYAFEFNRLNPDGTARGNLVARKGELTYGLIYSIHQEKFDLLSQTEPHYDLESIEVETPSGFKKAFAFICKDCVDDITPTQKYFEQIIRDALEVGLPEVYINKLRQKGKAK